VSKQSGLGDALYVAGSDLSGDTQSLGAIGGGPAVIDVTSINRSAYERIGGRRDGRIEWTSFFNDATGAAHPVLKSLPTTDVHLMYCRGTTLGNPVASMVAKQINYDGSRSDDGAFTFSLQAQANGYGIEWGRLLTAGTRTDTAATNGSSIDTTASASFGGQAYLQVTDFSGTDVTVKIQDSADNSNWADVAGLAFTQVTSAPTTERISISNTSTIRRYVRAVTTTTGGLTSVSFVVALVKNEVAGVSF
jgi:hypothetical protein